jgi:selenocysteine-specific elongation factor
VRVVATAGHVDHGKSSLVLALTGTDPDRFAEEKARGLTIDLGFAFMTLPSGQELGFVDVPGHVRFLKNMLAGVGAVEAALLVVAATEGWMPQSEEHLRILDLLGVRHGLAVVSKADLVDDDLLELARLEVEERLETSSFSPTAVLAVDSRSGRGLPELREALDGMLASAPLAVDAGRPRLWVDRVFAAKGAGTVVTGTLAGGSLPLDAELLIVPGRHRARLRKIESHHRELEEARPGSRVALNLAGVDHTDLRRGSALVVAGQWAHTAVVDVALTTLPGSNIGRRGAYKAYIGSGEHDVRLRLIDEEGRYARLRLDGPLPLAPGDRLVLRETGRQETVGGAEVLDVAPVGRVRLAPARLEQPLGPRLLAGRPWLKAPELVALAGVDPSGAERLAKELIASEAAVAVGGYLVAAPALEETRRRVTEAVAEHHQRHPLEPGLELTALAPGLGLDPPRLRAALEGAPGLVVESGRVRAATHRTRVSEDPEAQRVLAALGAEPFAPPAPADVGARPEIVRGLVREGLLVDVEGLVFTAAALEQARDVVRRGLAEHGSLTVAQARDLLGSSRKDVLALLARMDADGVTRRRGDERFPGPRLGEGPPPA